MSDLLEKYLLHLEQMKAQIIHLKIDPSLKRKPTCTELHVNAFLNFIICSKTFVQKLNVRAMRMIEKTILLLISSPNPHKT